MPSRADIVVTLAEDRSVLEISPNAAGSR
jgi:hypothetical protein